MDDRVPAPSPTRYLHQCPGCWGYGLFAKPMSKLKGEGWIECECGERMTRIDLRDSESREAARAEGRREAVRDGERLYREWWQVSWNAGNYPPQWEQLSHPTRDVWNAFAERLMAGLNASESPLTDNDWPDKMPWNPEWDASESGQPRCCLDCIDDAGDKCEHPGCLCHSIGVGDASESGQPPEASDE